jgi:hypothetical protein
MCFLVLIAISGNRGDPVLFFKVKITGPSLLEKLRNPW